MESKKIPGGEKSTEWFLLGAIIFWGKIFLARKTQIHLPKVQGKSVSNRKESQKEGFFGSTKSDGDVHQLQYIIHSF